MDMEPSVIKHRRRGADNASTGTRHRAHLSHKVTSPQEAVRNIPDLHTAGKERSDAGSKGRESQGRAALLSWARTGWGRCRLLRPCLEDYTLGLGLCMLGCLVVMALDRAVSLVLPLANKWVMNDLSGAERREGQVGPDWQLLTASVLLHTLHGPGFLGSLRTLLWQRVAQHTRKRLYVRAFEQVMAQSLRWHVQRKSGEVAKVIERGVQSVNSLVSQVLFHLAPAVLDVCVAVLYFTTAFDLATGLIVCASMVGYLLSAVVLGRRRKACMQQQHEAGLHMTSTLCEALINFETVKCHAAESFEVERYSQAIEASLAAESSRSRAVALVQFSQRAMKNLGLLAGSLLCALRVSQGAFTVGDYTLFVTYLNQVYSPLNTFSGYMRSLQQDLKDVEALLDLLQQVPEIQDAPHAKDIEVKQGKVEFQDVSFQYEPQREILKGISFTAEPGQTVALVGHSGGGKTTITRLLLRLLEPHNGRILIDGVDISNFTQESLRKQIGVVPQDTVLFNQDIHYNISYSRPSASRAEVEAAARDASLHERVLGFPEQYSTRVGERGMRVSGGEKQRIAIARTLLKDAPLVILDEATSSLDTGTESHIQEALGRAYSGKTTLVVAHRLSTIRHADIILVLEHGEVVESGCHEELMDLGGLYCRLWSVQQLDSSSDVSGDVNCDVSSDVSVDVSGDVSCDNDSDTAPSTDNYGGENGPVIQTETGASSDYLLS